MRKTPTRSKKKKIDVEFKDFPFENLQFDFVNRGDGKFLKVEDTPVGIKVKARKALKTFPSEELEFMQNEENGLFTLRLVIGCFLGALIISALEGLITH